jgi:hypothetical protein
MLSKLLLSLSVFCFLHVSAQEEKFDPNKCSKIYLKPDALSISSEFSFSRATVVDRRFDTSKLGYAKPSAFVTSVITTRKPFAETMTEAIAKATKNKLSRDTGKQLLIVIRHFWLNGQSIDAVHKSSCTVSLDVYLKNNEQFSPLFKIDTVLSSNKALLRADNDFLAESFQVCFEKVKGIPLEQTIARRRKFSEQEINAFYEEQFRNVHAKGDSLVKGVFLTFKDFLQNRPAYTEFRVANEDLSDDLYVIQNGKETLLSKFWGYCDGKRNYLKLGYSLFPLYRQNNTYDLYGANEVDHRGVPDSRDHNVISHAIKTYQEDRLILKGMQLNMETGKVY